MLVTNNTASDYWFGPIHLAGGAVNFSVDDTTATSLYLTNDGVADAINALYASGKISVSGAALPFPRPTGDPQILHGDGSPEGLVFAGMGSMFMSRSAGSTINYLYTKTTGISFNTGWLAINPSSAPGYVTTLPGTPSDGQECILVDSTTAPTYQWRFRYNNGSVNTDKWEFIGGVPVFLNNTTTQTNGAGGSNSYTDFSGGLTFTVPRAGVYDIGFGGIIKVNAVNGSPGNGYLTPKLGSAATTDADGVYQYVPWSGAANPIRWHPQKVLRTLASASGTTRLGASDIVKLQFRSSSSQAGQTSDDFQVFGAELTITPVRVS